jgi:hypothetical protein
MGTKEENRRYYEKNREKRYACNERQKERIRDFLWSYLETHSCADCGENDPIVLQFDHVRGEKKFAVSQAVEKKLGLDRVQSEIDKCEVRCANCHVRKTAKERGYWKDKRGL